MKEAEKAAKNIHWTLPAEIEEKSIGVELKKHPERFLKAMHCFLQIINTTKEEVNHPDYLPNQQNWREKLKYFALLPLCTSFVQQESLHLDTEAMKGIVESSFVQQHAQSVAEKKRNLPAGRKLGKGSAKYDNESMNTK